MFCSADSVTKLLTEVDNLANLHTIISVDPVTDD